MRRQTEEIIILTCQLITAHINRTWPFSIYFLAGDSVAVDVRLLYDPSANSVTRTTVSLEVRNCFFTNGNTLFSFDLNRHLQITHYENQSDADSDVAFLRHIIAMKRLVNQLICPYLMLIFSAITQEGQELNEKLSFEP